ncbi:MAG: hypothetical protein IRY83_10335 [Chloroflexi bacterium]|nr:hypothetical protein [Chloroflexota bacterium]
MPVLEEVETDVRAPPELARQWDKLAESVRASLSLEWDQPVVKVRRLEATYQSSGVQAEEAVTKTASPVQGSRAGACSGVSRGLPAAGGRG